MDKRTNTKKPLQIALWILQIAAILIFAYVIFLRFQAGQHISMPAIGCVVLVLLGVVRIVSARNRHQSSEEDQKKFRKITIRSVILAPILAIAFITIVVLIKLNM